MHRSTTMGTPLRPDRPETSHSPWNGRGERIGDRVWAQQDVRYDGHLSCDVCFHTS